MEDKSRERQIAAREDAYRLQRLNRPLSPERADPFATETPAAELSSYSEVMTNQQLENERTEILRKIERSKEEGTFKAPPSELEEPPKKKGRWDSSTKEGEEKGNKWDTPNISTETPSETPVMKTPDAWAAAQETPTESTPGDTP